MTGFDSKRQASLDTLDHLPYQGRESRPDELAQPQAEPVAWRRYNRSIGWQYEDGVTSFASDPSAEPLYAAPQAVAEPLSAERVNAILMVQPGLLAQEWFFAFARAIEQAHGIGVKRSAA